jgi:hypothetical protein
MNSKVKSQANKAMLCICETKLSTNLISDNLAGPSWPLYIGV